MSFVDRFPDSRWMLLKYWWWFRGQPRDKIVVADHSEMSKGVFFGAEPILPSTGKVVKVRKLKSWYEWGYPFKGSCFSPVSTNISFALAPTQANIDMATGWLKNRLSILGLTDRAVLCYIDGITHSPKDHGELVVRWAGEIAHGSGDWSSPELELEPEPEPNHRREAIMAQRSKKRPQE